MRKLARKYEYLWPDKPGQSKEQKADSLRHRLTDHIPHIGEKIEAVREEEKEHTKSLSDMANEFLCEFYDNMMKAKAAAKTSQEFMYASNAGAPGANLIIKLNVPGKDAGETESDDFIEALKGTAKDDWKDTGPIQVETSEQKTEDGSELVDG